MKLSQQILEEIIDMGNSLGITRDKMPQIDKEHISDFVSYLRLEKGVGVELRSISANDLQPSQNELDTEKADKIFADGAHTERIFISRDNYVLDGHHRWLAVKRNDPETPMSVIKIFKDAEECLELMHGFDKTKKRDIEDSVVECKLARQVLNLINEDNNADYEDNFNDHLFELGFEGIEVTEIINDVEDKSTSVVFTDGEYELLAVFFVDDELGPVVTVVEDESELENEVDVLEIKAPVVDGMIDFDNGISWLSSDEIEAILTWDEVSERTVTVIRKGKKVRKQLKRKIRKKRLTAKRKLAIKRGVRKRKVKKAAITRKRKRSLAIRKRAKLKKRPKNLRVVG